MFQDVRPMELGHVERGRGSGGVTGRRVALGGDGRGGHVQWGGALLVELALAVLVQRQRQALPLLPAVAEPHAHHLGKGNRVRKLPTATSGARAEAERTSLSRPRSSEMCVISCVLGFGHLMKYASRAERTAPSRLVLRFLFLVSTNTRSTLYICRTGVGHY